MAYIYSSRQKQKSVSIYGSTVLLSDLGCFFSFLTLYADGRTPWTNDHPVARPLPTRRTTQTQNKRMHTSMPWVGFEPTIPAFERAKTVHALDHAATVIGKKKCIYELIICFILITVPLDRMCLFTHSVITNPNWSRTILLIWCGYCNCLLSLIRSYFDTDAKRGRLLSSRPWVSSDICILQ
jgi:hypothetical protein